MGWLRYMLLFIFSTFLLKGSLAQERPYRGQTRERQFPQAKISGAVFDQESGESLEYATASLIRLPDSTLVTGAVTDANGFFEITT